MAEAEIKFKVAYNKKTHDIAMSPSSTVGELKLLLQTLTSCPNASQKLSFKGLLSGPGKPELDTKTLVEAGIVNGSKILLIGASTEQILNFSAGAAAAAIEPDVPSVPEDEKLCEKTEHKKILAGGVPSDAPFAFRPDQDPLPTEFISGLQMQGGHKARFSVRLLEGVFVLATNERTQKFPIESVVKVYSEPIPKLEHYHILALQYGPTDRSTLYLYWFPAQYISAIKAVFARRP